MSELNNIISDFDRVSSKLIEAIKHIPSATLHEAYGQKGALQSKIRPIRPNMKLCGPAVTVQARPGDNLIIHKAIYVARPGDVLLVDTGSYVEAGFWGEITTVASIQRGINGLVTNGSVRDTSRIAELAFPTFCQGTSIKGTTKNCLGTINHSIVLGDVRVSPGDLVVGDADGVVVVKKAHVADLLKEAKSREEKEEQFMSQIRSGKTTLELYGFDKKLEALGLSK